MNPPQMRFLDATHALFAPNGQGPIPLYVVDVTAGTITALPDDAVPLEGRFAHVEGAILDMISGARFSLTPTAAAWDAAPEVMPSCK